MPVSVMPISSPNPMGDNLLELDIGCGEKKAQEVLIDVALRILSGALMCYCKTMIFMMGGVLIVQSIIH